MFKHSKNTSYGTINPVTPSHDHTEASFDQVKPARLKPTGKFVRGGILAAVLTIGTILYLSVRLLSTGCYGGIFGPPIPGPRKWSDFRNESFAVGIDLTAGYGTAAISFANGTVVDIGRAEGTTEYIEMMAKLSLKDSAHPTPPYYRCDLESKDVRRQWARYLLKKRGIPSSPEVAALITVLGPLITQVNHFLHASGTLCNASFLQTTLITVPYLPALYNEDLLDAAQHIGVQLLVLPPMIYMPGDAAMWPVTEINSVMAGNGYGVPSGISHDATPRLSTPGNLRSENVFSVLFIQKALTAHVGPFISATHFYAAQGIVDFKLGYGSKPSISGVYDNVDDEDDGSEDEYWFRIRTALRNALKSYPGRGENLGLVISHGESSIDPMFQRVLKDEVTRYQDHSSTSRSINDEDLNNRTGIVFVNEHPVFSAARGAAVFGRMCLPRPGGFGRFYSDQCFPDLRPRMQGWQDLIAQENLDRRTCQTSYVCKAAVLL